MLTIGEIDCRIDNGIIEHKEKFPEREIEEIIVTTPENYFSYILNNNSKCNHNIIIQGVPCPNIDTKNRTEKGVTQLVEVIKNLTVSWKIDQKKKDLDLDF